MPREARKVTQRIFSIAALAIGVALSGCASMTHLTRTRELTTNTEAPARAQTIIVDAKQRLITASPKVSRGSDVSFSIAEGAGSIGLRTQSIQLMRDAMYRLCEGVAALNEIEAARAQAVAGGGSAATKVEIKYPEGKGPDVTTITAVAQNVEKTVSKTLDLNWGPELCASVLLSTKDVKEAEEGSVAKICGNMLTKNVEFADSGIKLMSALALNLQNQRAPVA